MRRVSHFDLMFQILIFTHPSTPETTHVYVDNPRRPVKCGCQDFCLQLFPGVKAGQKAKPPTIHCWPTKLLKHDLFLNQMVIRNQLFQSFWGGLSIFHFNKNSFARKIHQMLLEKIIKVASTFDF